MSDTLRIAVCGMIAADPWQGGATWAVLQYVLGLRKLGHDVLFVEEIPRSKLLPPLCSLAESSNASYFRQVARRFNLDGRSALVVDSGDETVGMSYSEVRAFLSSADLLLNISGLLRRPDLFEAVGRRIYVDLDPGFTQIWHSAVGVDMGIDRHNGCVTIGLGIGDPDCPVPNCGRTWVKTPQPVVLDAWPWSADDHGDALTTVGNWRSYGSVHFAGEHYGQKAHSIRKLIDVPRRSGADFLLAMSIHADEVSDIAALATNGWRRVDPAAVANTPDEYHRFVERSFAEFGVAKSGYVAAKCGWFSDRSVCYLAAGRPVLAQDTGFSSWMPTGRGLLAFQTGDDVADGVASLRRDYRSHRSAARDIAVEYFDSDKILPRLLERVGGRV